MPQPFLDLGLIVTRLKEQVPALKQVEESTDRDSAIDSLKAVVPAAHVLPMRDAAGVNTLMNAVNQQITARFGVLLATRNVRDTRGVAAQGTLRPVRSAVADALLNWAPGEAYTPCQYGGGQILLLGDGVLWWLDEYRTTFEMRAT